MVAELEHLDFGELARRRREEHLPAVTRSGDARAKMDIQPDVPLLRHLRRARVETHPHEHRTAFEGVASGRGRGDGVRRVGERVEEGIALSVDLDAATGCKGLAQGAPVRGQGLRVVVSEVVKQPRGALDVREEEGDRAMWQLPHGEMIRQKEGWG